MTEKFFLKIDAESPDGEAIKCERQVKVACSSVMAATVVANVLKQDKDLRKIILEAMLLVMTKGELSEKISDEEYDQRVEKGSGDLEF
jgi:hypothetical protein